MFPQHEDFKESNPKATTPWWTEMRSGFAKAASKYQISQGDDVVFGLDKMLPLYKDNKRPIGDVITNPTSVIDVKHVLMHFVSTARSTSGFSLQTRCWIALTSDCIGRGGEFRFQSYDDWIWHPAIQVLDIKWKEMKNIHVYSMGIVPDLVHWLFDFYHCFGCYFMVENGLMRTDEEIKQGKVNVVFPSIFNTVESSSSRKLTAAIRSTISGPPDVKNRYSARSLRYGAITELALHRELSVFAGCARSGHSTGTTVDDYIDDNNPAYGLQAGMARRGYQDLASNLKAKIEVPRLEALGVEVAASVDELLSKVFIVHVPHFKKGQGKLHGVLRICLASLILYYPDVAKECGGGGNIICTSLNKAAREAQIFDHRYGDTSPEALLGEWSKLIASDLASRRMPIPVINSDSVSLAVGLNQALSMLTGLTNQMQSLAQLACSSSSRSSLSCSFLPFTVDSNNTPA
ncbi:hypothetical protein IV203_033599 [Nitzschia inconspicua]|uniref:Uncharacterized protein n=1 Tax=Nitzschia inconspicua TaxID=303405 RepID=A0A9K3M2M7_9STRA|nr:hypothetical protein IV203_033599 [Nitzschia inconspicua]